MTAEEQAADDRKVELVQRVEGMLKVLREGGGTGSWALTYSADLAPLMTTKYRLDPPHWMTVAERLLLVGIGDDQMPVIMSAAEDPSLPPGELELKTVTPTEATT